MRKILCSVLVAGNFIFAAAQTKIALHDQETTTVKKKKSLKDFKRNYDLNRAKLFTGNFPGKGNAFPMNTASKSATPFASIITERWGEVQAVGQDEKMLFQLNYNYGADAKFTVKLLDSQINVVKSFTVALPESTNNFAILNDYFYDEEGLRNFIVYAHYFVGNGGPENQRNEMIVVTEDGVIKTGFDGFSAKIVNAPSGPKIMTFSDGEDEMLISNYNLTDFSFNKSMAIPFDLLNFMSGSPLNFMDVKGEPSLVLAHYEKLFLDNDTFEVFPDNHLIVGIYDLDLNLKKNISLDISTAYPNEPYTIPMAEFGMFYGYGKYDITDKTFNDDEGLEVLYSISYFDLLGDNEWTNYYVGDEAGNRIKSLEQNIIGFSELQELPGHEDQIGLYIGGNKQVESLNMFNVKSWTPAFEFPAYYNGELLSLNFNRVAEADSYNYLFGMPDIVQENNLSFGKINHYNTQGQFKKTTRLSLGEGAINFTALLFKEPLTPNLFLNDGQPTYNYVSKHLFNGKGYNIFRVAKSETDIIFETEGDVIKGNVVGNSYLKNTSDKIDKLALLYTTGDDNITIDFYDLPFTLLNTQSNSVKNNLMVVADEKSKTIRWNQASVSYTIYSMTGSLVRQGGKGDSVSSAGLPKGVYLLSITTPKGKQLTKRFIL